MKAFEKELPENYRLVKTVDCKDKKTAVVLNAAAISVTVIALVIGLLILKPSAKSVVGAFEENYLLSVAKLAFFLAAFLAANILYIVLHELTHGLAYKLLTKQKLKFGFSLTFAYCGVPDIYVYRTAALISLLAPFTVFIVLFALLAAFLPTVTFKAFAVIMLAVHLGGCVGDLYDTFLYLFKFRSGKVLMRDFGAKQEFYDITADELSKTDAI